MINFDSPTGVPGKFIIVRQDKGIITFSEVQVNPGTYKYYPLSHRNPYLAKYFWETSTYSTSVLSENELELYNSTKTK